MGAVPGARFPRSARLLSGGDFRRVLKRGLRIEGPFFLLVAAPGPSVRSRLGLVASRKVGVAVERNRAKRLLREGFRRGGLAGPLSFDLVLVAKRRLVGCRQAEVDHEYRESLRRLLAEWARLRRPRTRPAG